MRKLYKKTAVPQPQRKITRPYLFFSLFSLVLTATSYTVLTSVGSLPTLLSYLISANLTTLSLCGYDKAISGSNATRIPEATLFGLAVIGGSIGLILGMLLFRHKTSKLFFVSVLLIIAACQITILLKS